MRRFNPDKELKKIQHGNKNKIIVGVVALLVVLAIGSTYALYQVRYSKRIIYTKVAPFSNTSDLDLAIYVDGKKKNEAPYKEDGYTFITLICDKEYKGNVAWDEENQFLSLAQVQMPIPNKCNAYFFSDDYDGIKTIEYNGEVQEYMAENSGYYKIELWGAQGGNSTQGGKGAYTSGVIELNKDTTLYINVGGNGSSHNGYNGGGTSHNESFFGGGATDIRTESNNLYSRIMVAAGGSANSFDNKTVQNNGVAGGGLVGNSGTYSYYCCSRRQNPITKPAGGGTQISPGSAMSCSGGCMYGTANSGSFGVGANEGSTLNYPGGAGGGWYGGGGSVTTDCLYPSSGSGSSYISGHIGCIGTKSESVHTYDENCTTNPTYECSTSYTGYAFINTIMIDGDGYNWSTKKENHIGMPNPNGDGVIDGNSGDGHAKITYIGPAN